MSSFVLRHDPKTSKGPQRITGCKQDYLGHTFTSIKPCNDTDMLTLKIGRNISKLNDKCILSENSKIDKLSVPEQSSEKVLYSARLDSKEEKAKSSDLEHHGFGKGKRKSIHGTDEESVINFIRDKRFRRQNYTKVPSDNEITNYNDTGKIDTLFDGPQAKQDKSYEGFFIVDNSQLKPLCFRHFSKERGYKKAFKSFGSVHKSDSKMALEPSLKSQSVFRDLKRSLRQIQDVNVTKAERSPDFALKRTPMYGHQTFSRNRSCNLKSNVSRSNFADGPGDFFKRLSVYPNGNTVPNAKASLLKDKITINSMMKNSLQVPSRGTKLIGSKKTEMETDVIENKPSTLESSLNSSIKQNVGSLFPHLIFGQDEFAAVSKQSAEDSKDRLIGPQTNDKNANAPSNSSGSIVSIVSKIGFKCFSDEEIDTTRGQETSNYVVCKNNNNAKNKKILLGSGSNYDYISTGDNSWVDGNPPKLSIEKFNAKKKLTIRCRKRQYFKTEDRCHCETFGRDHPKRLEWKSLNNSMGGHRNELSFRNPKDEQIVPSNNGHSICTSTTNFSPKRLSYKDQRSKNHIENFKTNLTENVSGLVEANLPSSKNKLFSFPNKNRSSIEQFFQNKNPAEGTRPSGQQLKKESRKKITRPTSEDIVVIGTQCAWGSNIEKHRINTNTNTNTFSRNKNCAKFPIHYNKIQTGKNNDDPNLFVDIEANEGECVRGEKVIKSKSIKHGMKEDTGKPDRQHFHPMLSTGMAFLRLSDESKAESASNTISGTSLRKKCFATSPSLGVLHSALKKKRPSPEINGNDIDLCVDAKGKDIKEDNRVFIEKKCLSTTRLVDKSKTYDNLEISVVPTTDKEKWNVQYFPSDSKTKACRKNSLIETDEYARMMDVPCCKRNKTHLRSFQKSQVENFSKVPIEIPSETFGRSVETARDGSTKVSPEFDILSDATKLRTESKTLGKRKEKAKFKSDVNIPCKRKVISLNMESENYVNALTMPMKQPSCIKSKYVQKLSILPRQKEVVLDLEPENHVNVLTIPVKDYSEDLKRDKLVGHVQQLTISPSVKEGAPALESEKPVNAPTTPMKVIILDDSNNNSNEKVETIQKKAIINKSALKRESEGSRCFFTEVKNFKPNYDPKFKQKYEEDLSNSEKHKENRIGSAKNANKTCVEIKSKLCNLTDERRERKGHLQILENALNLKSKARESLESRVKALAAGVNKHPKSQGSKGDAERSEESRGRKKDQKRSSKAEHTAQVTKEYKPVSAQLFDSFKDGSGYVELSRDNINQSCRKEQRNLNIDLKAKNHRSTAEDKSTDSLPNNIKKAMILDDSKPVREAIIRCNENNFVSDFQEFDYKLRSKDLSETFVRGKSTDVNKSQKGQLPKINIKNKSKRSFDKNGDVAQGNGLNFVRECNANLNANTIGSEVLVPMRDIRKYLTSPTQLENNKCFPSPHKVIQEFKRKEKSILLDIRLGSERVLKYQDVQTNCNFIFKQNDFCNSHFDEKVLDSIENLLHLDSASHNGKKYKYREGTCREDGGMWPSESDPNECSEMVAGARIGRNVSGLLLENSKYGQGELELYCTQESSNFGKYFSTEYAPENADENADFKHRIILKEQNNCGNSSQNGKFKSLEKIFSGAKINTNRNAKARLKSMQHRKVSSVQRSQINSVKGEKTTKEPSRFPHRTQPIGLPQSGSSTPTASSRSLSTNASPGLKHSEGASKSARTRLRNASEGKTTSIKTLSSVRKPQVKTNRDKDDKKTRGPKGFSHSTQPSGLPQSGSSTPAVSSETFSAPKQPSFSATGAAGLKHSKVVSKSTTKGSTPAGKIIPSVQTADKNMEISPKKSAPPEAKFPYRSQTLGLSRSASALSVASSPAERPARALRSPSISKPFPHRTQTLGLSTSGSTISAQATPRSKQSSQLGTKPARGPETSEAIKGVKTSQRKSTIGTKSNIGSKAMDVKPSRESKIPERKRAVKYSAKVETTADKSKAQSLEKGKPAASAKRSMPDKKPRSPGVKPRAKQTNSKRSTKMGETKVEKDRARGDKADKHVPMTDDKSHELKGDKQPPSEKILPKSDDSKKIKKSQDIKPAGQETFVSQLSIPIKRTVNGSKKVMPTETVKPSEKSKTFVSQMFVPIGKADTQAKPTTADQKFDLEFNNKSSKETKKSSLKERLEVEESKKEVKKGSRTSKSLGATTFHTTMPADESHKKKWSAEVDEKNRFPRQISHKTNEETSKQRQFKISTDETDKVSTKSAQKKVEEASRETLERKDMEKGDYKKEKSGRRESGESKPKFRSEAKKILQSRKVITALSLPKPDKKLITAVQGQEKVSLGQIFDGTEQNKVEEASRETLERKDMEKGDYKKEKSGRRESGESKPKFRSEAKKILQSRKVITALSLPKPDKKLITAVQGQEKVSLGQIFDGTEQNKVEEASRETLERKDMEKGDYKKEKSGRRESGESKPKFRSEAKKILQSRKVITALSLPKPDKKLITAVQGQEKVSLGQIFDGTEQNKVEEASRETLERKDMEKGDYKKEKSGRRESGESKPKFRSEAKKILQSRKVITALSLPKPDKKLITAVQGQEKVSLGQIFDGTEQNKVEEASRETLERKDMEKGDYKKEKSVRKESRESKPKFRSEAKKILQSRKVITALSLPKPEKKLIAVQGRAVDAKETHMKIPDENERGRIKKPEHKSQMKEFISTVVPKTKPTIEASAPQKMDQIEGKTRQSDKETKAIERIFLKPPVGEEKSIPHIVIQKTKETGKMEAKDQAHRKSSEPSKKIEPKTKALLMKISKHLDESVKKKLHKGAKEKVIYRSKDTSSRKKHKRLMSESERDLCEIERLETNLRKLQKELKIIDEKSSKLGVRKKDLCEVRHSESIKAIEGDKKMKFKIDWKRGDRKFKTTKKFIDCMKKCYNNFSANCNVEKSRSEHISNQLGHFSKDKSTLKEDGTPQATLLENIHQKERRYCQLHRDRDKNKASVEKSCSLNCALISLTTNGIGVKSENPEVFFLGAKADSIAVTDNLGDEMNTRTLRESRNDGHPELDTLIDWKLIGMEEAQSEKYTDFLESIQNKTNSNNGDTFLVESRLRKFIAFIRNQDLSIFQKNKERLCYNDLGERTDANKQNSKVPSDYSSPRNKSRARGERSATEMFTLRHRIKKDGNEDFVQVVPNILEQKLNFKMPREKNSKEIVLRGCLSSECQGRVSMHQPRISMWKLLNKRTIADQKVKVKNILKQLIRKVSNRTLEQVSKRFLDAPTF